MNDKRFKNVKELRKCYSLTQEEMSYFIGISARNYREKERGFIPFTQVDIMKIVLLFDLSPEEMYSLFYTKSTDKFFWKKVKTYSSDNLEAFKKNEIKQKLK